MLGFVAGKATSRTRLISYEQGDPKDPDNRGLNGFLDDWRANRGADKKLDLMPGYGTVDWWFERYYRTDAFLKKVSAGQTTENR